MTKDPFKKFQLKKPCGNCPFTIDNKNAIKLKKGRRESIINDLKHGITTEFICHKTIETDRALCAGAIAVCKKNGFNMPAEDFAIRVGLIEEDHYLEVEGQDNFDIVFNKVE